MAREHVHLIGIGGTGMTALAGLLAESGARVTGSDGGLYPPTSEILAAMGREMGLEVHEGFDAAHLHPAPDLVVVGNAISRGNPEVEELLDRDLDYTSMPRLLGERFLRQRHSIVVAGTHGKTTTSAMLSFVLQSAGRDPGFLIGGQPRDFERPFRLGQGPAFVVEGDEYDTAFFDKGPKFMHYRPDTALVGTVEFDHADIYRDLAEIETAFRRLTRLVPRRGLVVRHEDCPETRRATDGAPCRTEGYGLSSGEWTAVDKQESGEGTRFRVLRGGAPFCEVALAVGGEHNLRNALAVVAAASEQGLGPLEIARGLASFSGVRRRLERRGEAAGVTVYDDFAHHPTAIEATLQALRARTRGRLWAVLEPRSWSLRRSVFQERLSRSFDFADEVVIAAVHRPEQIPAAERLDPERLVADLVRRGKRARFVPDAAAIASLLAEFAAPGDSVAVMSNGSFEALHGRLLTALEVRAEALREP